MNFIGKTFLSLFGIGYLPFMPGTFGSIASVFILFFLEKELNTTLNAVFGLWILFVGVFFLSMYFIKNIVSEKNYDQPWIVIDEFLGMLISTILIFFVENAHIELFIISFILFRFFDIFKPLGIRKIDKGNSPAAVILDDLLAGIYTFVLTIPIYYLFLQ